MIFFNKSEPGLVINSKKTKKIIARFKNGKFETDDLVLIDKLKPYFRHRVKVENKRKGKTFEEIYGKKKAKKMKLGMSRHHYKTLKEVK
jgi:hypothetical protein